MTDAKEKIRQILDKDQLSAEESSWLLNYVENTDQHELQAILRSEFNNDSSEKLKNSDKLLDQIHQKLNIHEESVAVFRQMWVKIAVAASVIGLLLFAGWFYKDKKAVNIAVNKVKPNVVKPVTEKAMLALEDGSTIILGKVKNGTVISQSNSNITKTSGKLAYNSNINTRRVAFNTLTTPYGGHYRLELPDGTKVWLNTASSITYPTAFTGVQRLVKITGEAYFEVAKNKNMPFIVSANNSQIRVYGTHFNVMAYNDEATVKTTLLEGSVKCTNGQSSCMLKPGEQSELEKNGRYKVSSITSINNTVAWKNGLFHFENADIESIMRQLEREYDVTVTYNKIVKDHFFAEVPLSASLADVLKILELTGKVHFEVKGKQIIVNP